MLQGCWMVLMLVLISVIVPGAQSELSTSTELMMVPRVKRMDMEMIKKIVLNPIIKHVKEHFGKVTNCSESDIPNCEDNKITVFGKVVDLNLIFKVLNMMSAFMSEEMKKTLKGYFMKIIEAAKEVEAALAEIEQIWNSAMGIVKQMRTKGDTILSTAFVELSKTVINGIAYTAPVLIPAIFIGNLLPLHLIFGKSYDIEEMNRQFGMIHNRLDKMEHWIVASMKKTDFALQKQALLECEVRIEEEHKLMKKYLNASDLHERTHYQDLFKRTVETDNFICEHRMRRSVLENGVLAANLIDLAVDVYQENKVMVLQFYLALHALIVKAMEVKTNYFQMLYTKNVYKIKVLMTNEWNKLNKQLIKKWKDFEYTLVSKDEWPTSVMKYNKQVASGHGQKAADTILKFLKQKYPFYHWAVFTYNPLPVWPEFNSASCGEHLYIPMVRGRNTIVMRVNKRALAPTEAELAGQDCISESDPHGFLYRGIHAATENNLLCLNWGSKEVEGKSTKWKASQSAVLKEAGAACRNPDKDAKGPWCHTGPKSAEFGYCNIPMCETPTGACYNRVLDMGNHCKFDPAGQSGQMFYINFQKMQQPNIFTLDKIIELSGEKHCAKDSTYAVVSSGADNNNKERLGMALSDRVICRTARKKLWRKPTVAETVMAYGEQVNLYWVDIIICRTGYTKFDKYVYHCEGSGFRSLDCGYHG